MLDTPINTQIPNGQRENKLDYTFNILDRDSFFDWYKAYFAVSFKLNALANGANVNGRVAPINGSFSLIDKITVTANSTRLFESIGGIHNVIFIKNLLRFSDDYARSTAKNEFWYLDDTNTSVVADGNGRNKGMAVRKSLTTDNAVVKTVIPLNRFSFFEGLEDDLLPPMRIEIKVNLQHDDELIYKDAG